VPEDLFTWAEQHPCQAPAAPVQQPRISPSVPSVSSVPALPSEFSAIWAVLELHRGADFAITAPEIALTAGLWPEMSPANCGTKVRKILEITQDYWPWPVCGDRDGFYLAATAEEMAHYSANLRSRAMGILRRFASHRRAGRRAGFEYLGHGRWAANTKEVMPIARACNQ